MSFLTLPAGVLQDFSKAIISFWFRVPQASLDKARKVYESNPNPLALNNGIVPLVVMGKHGTGQVPYQNKYQSSDQSTWDQLLWNTLSANYIAGTPYNLDGPNDNCSWQPLPGNPYPIYFANNPLVVTGPIPQADPTYIGVDPDGNLYVSFQTAQAPDVVGWDWYLASVTPGSEVNAISDYGGFPLVDGNYLDNGTGGSGPNDPFIYDSEQFYFWQGSGSGRIQVHAPGGHNIIMQKEHYADIDGVPTGVITNDGGQSVTADQWHHVLISVDLATIASRGAKDQSEDTNNLANFISGVSKLYIAVDDINYKQGYIGDGFGDNDVITLEARRIAGDIAHTDTLDNLLPMSAYTLMDPKVPSGSQAMGIPATSEFVNSIYKVEMAEFQMWTGISFDTGVVSNRRAFIDYKRDKDGNPISLKMYPVNPKVAEDRIGRRPDIMLHGSGRWINGSNTGTDGLSIDPDTGKATQIPSGQFVSTGKIKRYKPDPSIPPPGP